MESLSLEQLLLYAIATAIGVVITLGITKWMKRGDIAEKELEEKRDEREKEMLQMLKDMKLTIDQSFTSIKIHETMHTRHDERLRLMESKIETVQQDATRLREDILGKLLNNIQLK